MRTAHMWLGAKSSSLRIFDLVRHAARLAIARGTESSATIGNDQRSDALLTRSPRRSSSRQLASAFAWRSRGRSDCGREAKTRPMATCRHPPVPIELGRNLGGETPGDLPETWPRDRPRSGFWGMRFVVVNSTLQGAPNPRRNGLKAARVCRLGAIVAAGVTCLDQDSCGKPGVGHGSACATDPQH